MTKVLKQEDGVISIEVLIKGSKLSDSIEIEEIDLQFDVNKISTAVVKVRDGGAMAAIAEPFAQSEGDDFRPGNEIEISLGYGSNTTTVFKGIIISHRLMMKQNRTQLVVTCKDKAIQMTKGRQNGIYRDQSDSDVIKKIVEEKHGLDLDIQLTEPVLPVNFQFNCTDWDFLLTRARMNNMVVLTDKNRIKLQKLDFKSNVKYEINASQTVLDIDLNLDSDMISDAYELTAWNDKDQEKTEVSVQLSDKIDQGNVSANDLSNIAFKESSQHHTSTSLSRAELKLWGETLFNKAVLSKIKGQITIPGTATILPADMIEISGFSKRFNGKAFVSSVKHTLADGEWKTILEIGKSLDWGSALPDIEDIPASGLIPPVSGFQIGKVKKIDEDPEENYRVLVTFPSFPGVGQEDGLWVRLVVPYATKEAGFFFYPEIDDEVVVGFINNDPRYGIITGAVYNNQNKPKETADSKNQFKSIISRSGIKLRFDDEDKILEIETPDGNSIKLDDKEKAITIKDITGNELSMTDAGFKLDSPKDIVLSAKGNIDLSATSGISLTANSDLKADGANIQLSAKAGFTAKGNASAEVSAAGNTTVKGAIVMIN